MPNAKPKRPQESPQRALDQRMIVQAVDDLRAKPQMARRERRRSREAFESAVRWVWGPPDGAWGFSLARVCERLGRQPGQVQGDVWASLAPEVQERVRGMGVRA